MAARCGDCKYWEIRKGKAMQGHCKQRPPSVSFFGKIVWPKTNWSDSCGQFTKKEVKLFDLPDPPEMVSWTVEESNIIRAIPDISGYMLISCRLKSERDDLYERIKLKHQRDLGIVQQTGPPTAREHLVITLRKIIGWLVVLPNGPYQQEAGREFSPTFTRDLVDLIPLAEGANLVASAYRNRLRRTAWPNEPATFDGIFAPDTNLVRQIDSSLWVRRTEFEEDAARSLAQQSQKGADENISSE